MNKRYITAIAAYSKSENSHDLLKHSFSEIKPSKNDYIGWIFSIIITLYIIMSTFISGEIYNNTMVIINYFSNIQLALVGVIFTVYSILLVFLNDDYIKVVSQLSELQKKVVILKDQTDYYERVLLLNFIAFISTIAIYLLILFSGTYYEIISEYSCIYFLRYLIIVGLSVYISFSLRIFWELKSLIYNTILIFRTSMVIKLTKSINNDKK